MKKTRTSKPEAVPHTTAPSHSIEDLMRSLSDLNPRVRLEARRKLVQMGHPAVWPLLRQLRSGQTTVRWEAAKALAEIHDPQAAEGLVSALNDDDRDVRWVAAEGLAALGPKALKPLFETLVRDADSPWMREGAGHVLHALQDSPVSPITEPVRAALENRAPMFDVPVAAFSALGKLREMEQEPNSLEQIMRSAIGPRSS